MIGSVSFGALRAFVEVGRHGSIKRAAGELGVTPGAVSQQVRALEERLGAKLLDRRGRDIQLSAEGLRLYGTIAPSFEEIDEALQFFVARRAGSKTLTISTTPSFAACWLTSRLGQFTQAHPTIEIQLEISEQLADLRDDGVDIAIRYGLGKYPGLEVTRLFTPRLVVVANPTFLPPGGIEEPADCLRFPLLQDRYRADWSRWLKGLGLTPSRSATKGPSFVDDFLLIKAAIAGQGLAVVRDISAGDELAAGRLCVAYPQPVPVPESYFVVTRADHALPAKVRSFAQWVIEEAR